MINTITPILAGTFMDFSVSDVATMTAHVGDFMDDFEPILLVVVAVGVALMVVWVLVGIFKR